jgi:glycogen debranching enzyme
MALQASASPKASTMQRSLGTFSRSLRRPDWRHAVRQISCYAVIFGCLGITVAPLRCQESSTSQPILELSRPVRPWEFLSTTGTRASLLGNEAGQMEAWVYPLKIFRGFHLEFHTEGRTMPAETLARTVTVHPESATIVYAGDTFRVLETFCVPVKEPGAFIVLEVETEQPLEIEAFFRRDFQLEWPAAIGATYVEWLPEERAFYLGEERKKFAALVGSPAAAQPGEEYQSNYSQSRESSFRLGVTEKGKQTKIIAIAGSMEGRAAAEQRYQRILATYPDLLRESAQYYSDYLARTVRLSLPDKQLQEAYDWARISTVQGVVSNPFLGTGLVAGYRTSGESERPGFAWFFGRDSFWSSLALNAEGDFSTTRAALDFISKYQREDGKIPHEISQGASFVNWLTDYPYPYASADATPLYIIAVNDYVAKSGDVAYATEKWASLQKAYGFLRSTYDERGFPKNQGIGHGWVEGGPLLPVKTELYQTALGIEALHALGNLAHLTGKDGLSADLAKTFEQQEQQMNEAFWLPDAKRFAFALDQQNHPIDEPTALSTVAMWFGLLNGAHAQDMISQLAAPEHQTDWGMRIISSKSQKFSGGGYHYGSVWPLFTGWAAVGEYKYHRAFPAYGNLRSDALLALDGSLGHVTEVLSGDYYQPLSTSSPHQMWSAAMVISPLLRGLFGLETDAIAHKLTFTPHVPADWPSFTISNLPVAGSDITINYTRTADLLSVDFARTKGSGECQVEFGPSVSPRAKVTKVELNGKPLVFHMEQSPVDQHVVVRFPLAASKAQIKIFVQHNFGLGLSAHLPALGGSSEELRVLSETWSSAKDELTLDVEGIGGQAYLLKVLNAQEVQKVEGGSLEHAADGDFLRVATPASQEQAYTHTRIALHF